jgi:hypothetical protein
MGEFLLYQGEDGHTRLTVALEDGTLWLSQKQLTKLFGKAKGTISGHIKCIFEDGELQADAVVRLFRTTAYPKTKLIYRALLCYDYIHPCAPRPVGLARQPL